MLLVGGVDRSSVSLCTLQRPGHFNDVSRACKLCGGKLTQHCPGRCEVRMLEGM